jgi:ubiquinone/menaquinone biosynthesis C-methylase UbiE/uncharacterized protein YbaR (Trm112 family)|tara:strand:+ start:1315 stop:2199 length:885 start_codon:yes stop_codon:yes gene_type:complete
MTILDDSLEFLACPEDLGTLVKKENTLVCKSCNKEFKILNENTVELLPSEHYKVKLDTTPEYYKIWYDNLLLGNQYVKTDLKDEKIIIPTFLPRGFDEELVSKITFPQSSIVCEVGSGVKSLSLQYAKKSKLVFHTDFDLKDIENARKSARDQNLKNIVFVMCNYFHLPFKENSLPIVINTGVLGRHGAEHDDKLLEGLSKITAYGGKLIFDAYSMERKILPDINKVGRNFAYHKKDISSIISKFDLHIEKITGVGYMPIIGNQINKLYSIVNKISKIFLPPSRWIVNCNKFKN